MGGTGTGASVMVTKAPIAIATSATTATSAPMTAKATTAPLDTKVPAATLATKTPAAPVDTKATTAPVASSILTTKAITAPVASPILATKGSTATVASPVLATKATIAPVASPILASKANTAPVASPVLGLATKATTAPVASPIKAPEVASVPVAAKPILQPSVVPKGPRAAAQSNPSFNFGVSGSQAQAAFNPFDVADAPDKPQRKVYMINDLVFSTKLDYDGPSGNSKQVRVGFIFDGSKYLITSDEDIPAQSVLQTLINTMVAQGKLQKFGCGQIPVVGEVLIGDYLQEYFRAVVTDVDREARIATLEFVDFGDVARCSIDGLLIPTDEIMKDPLYGVAVQLPGIHAGTPVPEQVTDVLDKTKVVVKYEHDRELPIKYNMVGRIFTVDGDDIKFAVEYLNSLPR